MPCGQKITDYLNEIGICTDNIYCTDENISNGAYVDHSNDKYVGRISVTSDGFVDIEILEIVSEIRVMYAHYVKQNRFDDLVIPYIRIMKQK